MISKITDAIVMSGEPYDDTIFNDTWQRKCTDEELKELRNTLHGWCCTAFYNAKYKKKLWSVQKNIDNILKERERNDKRRNHNASK